MQRFLNDIFLRLPTFRVFQSFVLLLPNKEGDGLSVLKMLVDMKTPKISKCLVGVVPIT